MKTQIISGKGNDEWPKSRLKPGLLPALHWGSLRDLTLRVDAFQARA